MSSPPNLTKGGILRLLQTSGDSLDVPPRLQLISIKPLGSQHADPNAPERFRWVLSTLYKSNLLQIHS